MSIQPLILEMAIAIETRRRVRDYVVTWLILLAIGQGYLLWLAMAQKAKPTGIHLRGTVR